MEVERVDPIERASVCANGLSRQASRNTRLTRGSRAITSMHQIEVGGLEMQVGLVAELGVDRNQVVWSPTWMPWPA